MFALGCVFVGVGILLTGLLMLLFRRPEPPRWARPELVAMLVTVPVTGITGLGLGYILLGGYRLLHGMGDLYELAAPFGVAVVVAGLWRVFGIQRRLRAFNAIAPVTSPNTYMTTVPILGTDDPPRRELPSHRSIRKAA